MSLASGCDVTADRETGGAEWLVTLQDLVAPGDGHVVNDPLLHVPLVDPLLHECQRTFLLVVRLLTQLFWFSHILPEYHL